MNYDHEAKYTKAYYQKKLVEQRKKLNKLEKALPKDPSAENCRAINNLSLQMEFNQRMVDGFNEKEIARVKQKVINQISN